VPRPLQSFDSAMANVHRCQLCGTASQAGWPTRLDHRFGVSVEWVEE
jgi:hypothetical protein